MTVAPDVYPLSLRLLHWGTTLLVATQAVLAAVNALVYEGKPLLAEAVVQTHLSLGILLFGLTAIRLGLRSAAMTPRLPADMTPTARWFAGSLHAILYALLLLLPVTGYVKLAALGFEIQVFGVFALPPLPLDAALAAAARRLHSGGAIVLGGLLLLHIGAALLHCRLLGSPVLQRMWPSRQRLRNKGIGITE